jgi:hypothetical protein
MLAGVLVAAPAHLSAGNEVTNPDMAGGTTGWASPSTSDATIAAEASDGNPAPSLRITQVSTSEATASQCVDYDETTYGDGTPFRLAVHFLMDGFQSTGNTVGAVFKWCSDDACSSCALGTVNRVGGSASGGFSADTWYTLDGSNELSPAGARAVLVLIGEPFGSTASHSVLVDNVLVGPDNTPVELLSFEVSSAD